MFLVQFLVSFLNLAPSSRLQRLSIRSSFADVSGLLSGFDSEPGSELPFATPVDQMEVRGSRRSFGSASILNLAPSSH